MSTDLDDKQLVVAGCTLILGALLFWATIIGLIALAVKWVVG